MIKKIIALLAVFTLIIPTNIYASDTNKVTETYDLVVVGGEPEGVAAAVSAARNGADVLLIDYRSKLGGLITVSEMNVIDIAKNHRGEETSLGIFKEFHNMIGNTLTADIEKSVKAFHTLVNNESNITLKLKTSLERVFVEDSKVTKIEVKENGKLKYIEAKHFIDATADANLATMAGVPYTYGNEDIGKPNTKMAVTLMMHFEDVNWERMSNFVNNSGVATVYNDVAWGFWDFVEPYNEKEPNTNLRGLNVGHDSKGDVYINALQIFDIDGVNEAEKQKAIEAGKRETENILVWFRKGLPGFEDAKIAGYPEELYIRETRHIESLYNLKIEDVFENKDQWDKIAFGGYPVDMQATNKSAPNLIVVNPDQYAIPLRSIIPVNITNLLVTSKASGYESLAAGSVRVVPTGMSVAQGGGLASAIALTENINFHELSQNKELVTEIQTKLREQGAFLPDSEGLSFPYQDAPYYNDMKYLYTKGFLHLDYSNDLHEDEYVTRQEFYDDLYRILPVSDERTLFIKNFEPSSEEVYLNEIRNVFTYVFGAQTQSTFGLPKGNDKITYAEFIPVKANIVKHLYGQQ